MSQQTATLETVPARNILKKLFEEWGYYGKGEVWTNCPTQKVDVNIARITWDGTNLTIVGTFNAPCTGTISWIKLTLSEQQNNFSGIVYLDNVGASIEANKSYTIYYVETLSEPTTAPVQGP